MTEADVRRIVREEMEMSKAGFEQKVKLNVEAVMSGAVSRIMRDMKRPRI